MSQLVYDDDLILARNNLETCKKFKVYLNRCFLIKVLGPLKYFLGIEGFVGVEVYSYANGNLPLTFLRNTICLE